MRTEQKIVLIRGLEYRVMVPVHCTNLQFVMVLTVFVILSKDIIFHSSDIGRGRPYKNTQAS